MRNIKLTIAYLGANYCGWQTQRPRAGHGQGHLVSIQETVEKVLSNLLQEEIKITGSGRTDAGVHAQAQTANFRTQNQLKEYNIQRALNSLLPNDIVIRDVEEVDENFHARYSAKWKWYRYTVLNQGTPDVFFKHMVYHFPFALNVKEMRQAVKYLRGRHDFRAFQGRGSRGKPAVRTIKILRISKYSYNCNIIYIDLIADGFLHNMARRIVGLILETGRGRIKPVKVKEILESKDVSLGGPAVPARGLCLMHVE